MQNEDKWDKRPRFALDADITIYWPEVRPVWEDNEKTTESIKGE